MGVSIISKVITGLNAYRKPILVAAIAAMTVGIFVGCEQVYAATPKEPSKVSALASTEIGALSDQIKELVRGLEYSDKVAEDFVQMVIGWKDTQGQSVLAVWKKKLDKARADYEHDKISETRLAKVEESIAKELSQRIQKEISIDFSGEKFFDLADVIKQEEAQCLGYSQLFYVLGNSVQLSVKTIDVEEQMNGELSTGHIACIIGLSDSKIIMIDFAVLPKLLISKPFELKEEFTKVGNYLELKNKENPLRIHRRIRILDKNGLIAGIYSNRGIGYDKSGQHTQAISNFNKAIKLNPKYAHAYYNRGTVYNNLAQHTRAISDYTKAIELNPKYAEAYNNRGKAYFDVGQPTEAISDYTKAIEFNPKYALAYFSRGTAYGRSGQHTQAISDLNKAIELTPNYAAAYNNRGLVYANLGKHTHAIADFTKAIELNPKLAEAYYLRGINYALLGKPEEAKKDLLKAVELSPAKKADVKNVSDYFKLSLQLD